MRRRERAPAALSEVLAGYRVTMRSELARAGLIRPRFSRSGPHGPTSGGTGGRPPGSQRRVPGTSGDSGGKGLLRPGLSESIARLPSSTALVHAFTRDTSRESPSAAGRQESVPGQHAEVTSLVRALALHGVAMLRSHLASTLKPGRGVLIRSVSRRLGSVACVREDASPNEVSVLTNLRMPVSLPGCQTEPPAHRARLAGFTARSPPPPSPGEQSRRKISSH